WDMSRQESSQEVLGGICLAGNGPEAEAGTVMLVESVPVARAGHSALMAVRHGVTCAIRGIEDQSGPAATAPAKSERRALQDRPGSPAGTRSGSRSRRRPWPRGADEPRPFPAASVSGRPASTGADSWR